MGVSYSRNKKGVPSLVGHLIPLLKAPPFKIKALGLGSPFIRRLLNTYRVAFSGMEVERILKTDPKVFELLEHSYSDLVEYDRESSKPKLFIFGTHDPLITNANIQYVLNLKSPTNKAITIDQGGHGMTRNVTELAISEIKKFLWC